MVMLNFTMKIPGSDKLKDSRYVTCINDVRSKTRYVRAYFKQMESIPAQGSCPGLSTDEDKVNNDPMYNGFFCPPGLKLNKLKNNNLCCKCYTLERTYVNSCQKNNLSNKSINIYSNSMFSFLYNSSFYCQ